MKEYQNIKTFLQKAMFQIGLFCRRVISDLKGEEIVGMFYEKELQKKKKKNQKEFRVEKVIKRKYDKLYVKWKGYNNCFRSWIDKKHSINE